MVAAIASADTTARPWMLTAFLAIAIIAPIIGGVGFITLANQWRNRKRN
jgi:hypothetical protein